MADVLIVGAGPAGAVAATVLARAGARVCLLDRARFPRRKLCGDTLNPTALAILRRLGMASVPEGQGVRIDGMRVSGEGGIVIDARYPNGLHGRSIERVDLDGALVREAVAAGAELCEGTTVEGAIVERRGGADVVTGVRIRTGQGMLTNVRVPVTIAADGRHSTIAFALGLARHPRQPRRWALGAYAEGVEGTSSFGEMHIRPDRYIGVAPLPSGVTNVCLVRPAASDRLPGNPDDVLAAELGADPMLRDRFARARFVTRPGILWPLAVDRVEGAQIPDGLFLAGDAAGFIDPMTGDGLRFAIRGAEMTATAALDVFERGWTGVQAALLLSRRHEFAAKWRFNRTLRALVGSPTAVRTATLFARAVPGIVRAIILRASDCDVAGRQTAPSAARRLYARSYSRSSSTTA